MYDKYLETNREAKKAHDEGLKKAASERLAQVAKKKRLKKSQNEIKDHLP